MYVTRRDKEGRKPAAGAECLSTTGPSISQHWCGPGGELQAQALAVRWGILEQPLTPLQLASLSVSRGKQPPAPGLALSGPHGGTPHARHGQALNESQLVLQCRLKKVELTPGLFFPQSSHFYLKMMCWLQTNPRAVSCGSQVAMTLYFKAECRPGGRHRPRSSTREQGKQSRHRASGSEQQLNFIPQDAITPPPLPLGWPGCWSHFSLGRDPPPGSYLQIKAQALCFGQELRKHC